MGIRQGGYLGGLGPNEGFGGGNFPADQVCMKQPTDPRNVQGLIEAISSALDEQDKTVETLAITLSPIRVEQPGAATGASEPESATSPVVSALRAVLRRVTNQTARIDYIRRTVEL